MQIGCINPSAVKETAASTTTTTTTATPAASTTAPTAAVSPASLPLNQLLKDNGVVTLETVKSALNTVASGGFNRD